MAHVHRKKKKKKQKIVCIDIHTYHTVSETRKSRHTHDASKETT